MVNSYKIDQLSVKDFKGARAFTYQAKEKRLVLLRGPNGAGKSSNLQAIMSALLGDKASPVHMIRDGANEAAVIATLKGTDGSQIVITHEWSRKRDGGTEHKLTVKRIEPGDKVSTVARPQSAIDAMLNVLTLDPMQFFREKNAEKRATMIQQAAKLDPAKLTGLQQEIGNAEANRKALSGQLEKENAKVESLSGVIGKQPDDPSALLAQAEAKRAEAEQLRKAAAEHERLHDGIVVRKEVIDENRESLAQLERELQKMLLDIKTTKQFIEENERILGCEQRTLNAHQCSTPAMIQAIVDEAGKLTNQAATATEHQRLWGARAVAIADAEALRPKYEQASEAVDQLRAKRRLWIAAGLEQAGLNGIVGLDEDGRPLAYGKPVEDISGSERIKAGARLALATRPDIRVLLLDEADALGPEAIAEIDKWAETEGFQVFLSGVWMQTECADTIEIEDGEIVSAETSHQGR